MLTRRDVLRGGASAPLLSCLPVSSLGSGTRERVLEKAKKLAAGRNPVLRLLVPQGSLANIEENARSFEKSSGVGILITEVPVDEVSSRAILENATGRAGFDIALPATFGVPDLVESGALLPLDDLAKKHEPPELAEGCLYTLGDRYKGHLYGYQADGDVYMMFYNRSIMEDEALSKRYADAHGRELRIPQTWEELDSQMQFMHQPDAGRYGGCLYRIPGYIEWEWWIRMHAKGQMPLDEDMHPLFDGEAGVLALEELIAASAWQSPKSGSHGLFENWQEYSGGSVFANIGWGGTQKFLQSDQSAVKGGLLFGPTPGGMIGGQLLPISYFNWGWNYTVSSRCKEPELAYLFTLYVSLPDRSTIAVRAQDGFFDPHRDVHYEDVAVRKVYGKSFLEQHRKSMQACIPDLYLQGRDQYFTKLGRLLYRANQGELNPQRALHLAAQAWEQTTDRLGREAQIDQWKQIRASYPEHVLSRH